MHVEPGLLGQMLAHLMANAARGDEVARTALKEALVRGIVMGQDSTLLWWLTQDTGGRYVRIN